MARIPNDELERIKRDVSLLELAKSQGFVLEKQGKDYAVCCPFHEENTPSCIISPKSNLFNCFGCGAGGSVIDWVMKTKSFSFRKAAEYLQENYLPPLVASITPVAKVASKTETKNTESVKHSKPANSKHKKTDSPVDASMDNQTILQRVINFYHKTLLNSPEALAYCEKRGISAEAIEHFRLGYANRTLGLSLPKKSATIREQLKAIGLYRDTGREHFAGSLVIPIINEQGHVTEIYGRKTIDRLRKGTPKHTYLPGPHEGVFNVASFKHSKEIILCESLIDALSFWCHGFRHVTASYGVNGFSDEIKQALIDHQIKRVLIAYDRDEAGERAAKVVVETLAKDNIDCFRIQFPKGMDANSYATQMKPPEKALSLVIGKAHYMGEGKAPSLSSLQALVSPAKPEAKTAPTPNTSESQVQHEQPTLESHGHDLVITLGQHVYRVRGLKPEPGHDQLKVQLKVSQTDDQSALSRECDVQGRTNIAGAGCTGAMHLDKLDLYSSKQRQVFINQASVELGVQADEIKKDLGQLILALEAWQDEHSEQATKEKELEAMSVSDEQAALTLLKGKHLLERILTDFNSAGVVGEDTNKLVGYLASVSRKLDKPLAIMIQSSSAAGKSSLMDSLLAWVPEEERVQYSAMTGQSLYYMGQTNLKHKILAISEEEGASNASYALKLLQSEGEVTIASTGKDDNSGELVTKEYTVEGPVMLLMTTTAIDIDEELMNRCLVLSVNESREQTRAIHQAQRKKRTLEGLQTKAIKQQLLTLHQNAQRLLKPLAVINPYADQLTFLDDKTRTRRDHEKYLTLIDSIALLHQYQRPIKTLNMAGQALGSQVLEYIEVTPQDIEIANQLAHEVLGRTLDELPPQTRKLLSLITEQVQADSKTQTIETHDLRFSRRQVRDWCGWSETQVRVHMGRLTDMEYLLSHRGSRGQSFVYELLYSGEGSNNEPFLMGLLDVQKLGQLDVQGCTKAAGAGCTGAAKEKQASTMMESSRGSSPPFADSGLKNAGPSRPQRGPNAEVEKPPQPLNGMAYSDSTRVNGKNAHAAVLS